MTTMNVPLTDEMRESIEAHAAEEGYPSPGEYLQALIRDALREKARRNLEAKLVEALDGGPAEPMTREDWDSLERRVWERHHRDQAPGSSES